MINKYLFLLFILFANLGFSQSECYNSDFSEGTFSGWEGYTGTYNRPKKDKGFKETRQTIITESTLDPRTGNMLATLPPGEKFAAKLGNESAGAETEVLIYSMNVTPENSIFLYKYAVVVEDPDHTPKEQPQFSVTITDVNGQTIDPLCGDYNVYAGQPDQNFNTYEYIDLKTHRTRIVKWTDWKTVGVNLSAYIGTTVKIEFTTKDCALKEHFGYAYISAKCNKLKADLKVCSNTPTFDLIAPFGFNKYLWTYLGKPVGTNSSTTSLPVADYPKGAIFECTMTAYSNSNLCESKIEIILTKPTKITPLFEAITSCNTSQTTFNPIVFENQSITTETNVKWNWDFGDGSTSIEKSPKHVYTNSGRYIVNLTATSESGCTFNSSEPISINNNPILEPILNPDQNFCNQNATIGSINVGSQNLKWYSSLTSTEELALSTALVDKTIYYAAVYDNGCTGKRIGFTASVSNFSPPTGDAIQYFCTINKPTIIDLDAKGDGIKWFKNPTDKNALITSTALTNATYYAAQTDLKTGCESKERLKVTVVLEDPENILPASYTKQLCLDDELLISSLKDNNTEMIFYSSENATIPLSENTPVKNGSTYYASISDSKTNCESAKRAAILVSVVPCQLVVFNSITIDGNDLNDHFVVKNIEFFPENTVEIYNRFGQLVYHTAKYGVNENYFYGEANAGEVFQKSKKLPTGSYFYVINFKKNISSENNLQKGFLYISNNE
ncbi:PKD domain-containing protein [Flavobacterium sp. 90]|uniref:T9SS type B sorting domain-containing protein n=1 Tax=unclassified Flavobacterium TaxID=196869 RepID=UPI000EABA284|nr:MULTISPECIES: gliding motility-associated C-terminal domain-containing protein [unclassified Flavobacterium]RKR05504.1 PKD domain-containing protein [Flavobacterium sp. 81]TCK56819.1 PKD domain-containing protein [Flavobacterium sp. 90]